jgi:hypothetical protein
VPLSTPSPIPIPTAPRIVTRAIKVGEKVTGPLNAYDTWAIDLAASENGFVAVRLTWNLGLTWMNLKWEDRLFEGPQLPQGEGLLLVRMPVDAGRTYRLTILDAYPWENYGSPFVLDTSLE